MDTGIAFRPERQTGVTGVFRSQRSITLGEARVWRVLFRTDFADRFPVLVTEEFGPTDHLQTGKQYRIDELPVYRTVSGDSLDRVNGPIYDEESSNPTFQLVSRTISRLGISGVFGVVDEGTEIRRSTE